MWIWQIHRELYEELRQLPPGTGVAQVSLVNILADAYEETWENPQSGELWAHLLREAVRKNRSTNWVGGMCRVNGVSIHPTIPEEYRDLTIPQVQILWGLGQILDPQSWWGETPSFALQVKKFTQRWATRSEGTGSLYAHTYSVGTTQVRVVLEWAHLAQGANIMIHPCGETHLRASARFNGEPRYSLSYQRGELVTRLPEPGSMECLFLGVCHRMEAWMREFHRLPETPWNVTRMGLHSGAEAYCSSCDCFRTET